MTTAANTTAAPRWQKLLFQLALSVPELAIAGALGFAVFWGATALGCRALYPVCDSAGGLAIVVVGIIVSILVASGYWVLALVLGLAGRRRARYVLDAHRSRRRGRDLFRAHVARAQRTGRVPSGSRNRRAQRSGRSRSVDCGASSEPRRPRSSGCRAADADGRRRRTRRSSDEQRARVAHRRIGASAGKTTRAYWRACPLLTVGEVSDYYRFSIGPGQTARYAPLPDCAAGFDGAPLEYRVGDPLPNATGWWSDTAFAVPDGRLP